MSSKSAEDKPLTPSEEPNSVEIGLELPDLIRQKAAQMAAKQGVSLEDFILHAIDEKLSRSE